MASALPVCLPAPFPQTMSGLQINASAPGCALGLVLRAVRVCGACSLGGEGGHRAACLQRALGAGRRGSGLRGSGHGGAPPGSRGGHGEAPEKTARRRSTTRRAAGVRAWSSCCERPGRPWTRNLSSCGSVLTWSTRAAPERGFGAMLRVCAECAGWMGACGWCHFFVVEYTPVSFRVIVVA